MGRTPESPNSISQLPLYPLSAYASIEGSFPLSNERNITALAQDPDAFRAYYHLGTVAVSAVAAERYRQKSVALPATVLASRGDLYQYAAKVQDEIRAEADADLLAIIYGGRYTQLDVVVALVNPQGELVPRCFRIGQDPSSPAVLDLTQFIQFDTRRRLPPRRINL